MNTFAEQVRAVVRGGDRTLYEWILDKEERDRIFQVEGNQEFEVFTGYEDRFEWVEHCLSCLSFEGVVSFLSNEFSARILFVVIGQEEDRSFGLPLRYVRVAYLPNN